MTFSRLLLIGLLLFPLIREGPSATIQVVSSLFSGPCGTSFDHCVTAVGYGITENWTKLVLVDEDQTHGGWIGVNKAT